MGLGFKSQLLRWAILTPEDARLLKKLLLSCTFQNHRPADKQQS